MYYAGATCSGFILDKGDMGFIFYIGILKENKSKDEKLKVNYSYKIFSTITVLLNKIKDDMGY